MNIAICSWFTHWKWRFSVVTLWKITIFNRYINYKSACSIPILVYQRLIHSRETLSTNDMSHRGEVQRASPKAAADAAERTWRNVLWDPLVSGWLKRYVCFWSSIYIYMCMLYQIIDIYIYIIYCLLSIIYIYIIYFYIYFYI